MKKTLFLILMAMAFVTQAYSQITTAWTTTIPASARPDNSVAPTVAALETSTPLRHSFIIDLDATTYDNANDSTAFAAIGAAVKTEIDSNYVEEIFGLNPASDITMRIVITSIIRRWDAFEPGDLAGQYVADEDVFRVYGYCEWEIPPQ